MADQVVENGALNGVGVEAPHSIAQARVDDKGRLKLPAEFIEYLKKCGVEKVFITTVDLVLGRIYPISVWKANENLFSNAGDLAEQAEDVAYIAKYYGGDSDIDAQGRRSYTHRIAAQVKPRIAAGVVGFLQRADQHRGQGGARRALEPCAGEFVGQGEDVRKEGLK